GVPLAFTLAWLLFRPAHGAPAASSSAAARVEAVPAGDPDEATAYAAPSAVVVTPVAAAPAASASSGATFEGADASTWRDRLRDYVKGRDWARTVEPVRALAALDPASFHDPNVVGWTVGAAVALATTGGAPADAVFDTLSQRAGTDGLDVLFEIVRGRGGTKGSKRAAELLRNPEIAAMEPPPLRVVFELHDAPCEKKPALYDRAVKEGDRRALTELRAMREAECDRRRRHEDPCCFDHAPLDEAIKALRERLAK
ncbi:MAG TPA: hypothetical protein VHB21_27855, partial [Minicystis sp.]|nr:hypothetical protein [Minicystis sp.]